MDALISKLSTEDNIKSLSNYIKFMNGLSPTINISNELKNNIIPIVASEFADFDICNDYIKKNGYNLIFLNKQNRKKIIPTNRAFSKSINNLIDESAESNIRKYHDVNKYNRLF